MSSIGCAGTVCVDRDAGHGADARSVAAVRVRKIVRLFAAALGAASLAACAQSSVVTKNSGFSSASRQAE
ncbi:MAG TPA: hypothetical protein VNX69_07985, partial [Steroidobacteraceae bacterium]|nr:hypothetical protein [Steroidobacteraceae bacterium]